MQPGFAERMYVNAITSDPDRETVFSNRSPVGGVGVALKKRAHP